MAQRRMFSKQIVSTDAFLDMPVTSQLLYFHLNIEADDDGFVSSPKKIMKIVGSSSDDFKILIAKRFILSFESGVVVIKHWLIHNYIRKDTYTETKYLTEKALLDTKENGSYTERGLPVDGSSTQVRLGKGRVGQERKGKVSLNTTTEVVGVKDIFDLFYKSINPTINFGNTNQRKSAETLIEKVGLEKAINATKYAISIQGIKYAPTITTPTQLLNKYGELQGHWKKNSNSNVITI